MEVIGVILHFLPLSSPFPLFLTFPYPFVLFRMFVHLFTWLLEYITEVLGYIEITGTKLRYS